MKYISLGSRDETLWLATSETERNSDDECLAAEDMTAMIEVGARRRSQEGSRS